MRVVLRHLEVKAHMEILRSLTLLASAMFLTGCSTTYYSKAGALDADFERDLVLAEKHADSVIGNSKLMPAQSGLESAMRGLAIPGLRRQIIDDYLKDIGWEKKDKGKRISNWMRDPDPPSSGMGGIGALIHPQLDGFLVLNVGNNGPASKVGLRPGDVITEVDGTRADGMSFEEGLKMLMGKIGTSVSLTLRRPGVSALHVNLIREDTSRLRYQR